MEYILYHFPYDEISILGDFNVHHQLWLSSSFTYQPGEQIFNFASWPRAASAVPYLYLWPPWRHAQHSWTLPNFQLTLSNFPLCWAPLITILFPLSVLSLQCNLRQYYSDFPWDDYCFHVRDPSLCAERITEVIVSGMKLYIPHTFYNYKAKKPWFNFAGSCTVKDREAAHNLFCSHPSAETHVLYISVHNYAKSICQLTKNSFINRICQNPSNSSCDFWHLANISSNFTSSFPPLLQPDGFTAVFSFSKAELSVQTFATNSTLDDTGHIPPTPPSDYFIPKIKVLYYGVFHVRSGLDSQKAYSSEGVPPVVLKNCATKLTPCLVKLFCLCLSTFTYSSCWKFAHIQPVPSL